MKTLSVALLFMGLTAGAAVGDGVDGGVGGAAEVTITYTDQIGHTWKCLEWDDVKGCRTHLTTTHLGIRYDLWISPSENENDRRASWIPAGPSSAAPVPTDPVVTESGPAYYCPDGSGPLPAR